MRIVFMGTPEFAVPPLKAIAEAGHKIEAVFTQPDKPKNRGHKILPSPVKEYALKNGIDVYQPVSLKKGDDAGVAFETLKKINPDIIVVAAYGKILPKAILEFPKYGCVNIHASLLPKYRGPAPIQWCLINGEEKTGITIQKMAEGIDTGDMILSATVEIDSETTYSRLHDILSEMGAHLITEALELIESGSAYYKKQDDSESTHAPMITKELCHIDFTKPAGQIINLIRGLSAVPSAYTMIGAKRLKIYFACEASGIYEEQPGTIIDTEKFVIVCGDKKGIIPLDVQYEGGKRMAVNDFLRGRKLLKTVLT